MLVIAQETLGISDWLLTDRVFVNKHDSRMLVEAGESGMGGDKDFLTKPPTPHRHLVLADCQIQGGYGDYCTVGQEQGQ